MNVVFQQPYYILKIQCSYDITSAFFILVFALFSMQNSYFQCHDMSFTLQQQ